MHTKITLIAVLVLFGFQTVMAENQAGTVTFTLADGYYFFSKQRQLKNTSMPNLLLSYNFNPAWAIEGE